MLNEKQIILKKMANELFESNFTFEEIVNYFEDLDELIQSLFTDPVESAKAIFFGKVDCWNADGCYYRLNAYGNIEQFNLAQELLDLETGEHSEQRCKATYIASQFLEEFGYENELYQQYCELI